MIISRNTILWLDIDFLETLHESIYVYGLRDDGHNIGTVCLFKEIMFATKGNVTIILPDFVLISILDNAHFYLFMAFACMSRRPISS